MNSCAKFLFLATLILLCSGCSQGPRYALSAKSQARVEKIFRVLPQGLTLSQRIDFISGQLLNSSYKFDSLSQPRSDDAAAVPREELVVDFDAVDCVIFVDLVRSLAFSHDARGFIKTLIKTRYNGAKVAFYQRRHFLSDWWTRAPLNGVDITARLYPGAKRVVKMLNLREDGGAYVVGLPPVERTIRYLTPEMLSPEVIRQIQTGDIIGIYDREDGYDVSHTGVAIWKGTTLYFRHASSVKTDMKVVDAVLTQYLKGKPGLTVMRLIPY